MSECSETTRFLDLGFGTRQPGTVCGDKLMEDQKEMLKNLHFLGF